MFGLAFLTEESRRALGATVDPASVVPQHEQCVNCTNLAMESGWCEGCAAELFPPRPFIPE